MQSNHSKKPGNQATILIGKYRGYIGQVIGFFQEEDNGIPVENGLKGHVLNVEGVGKLAFWSGEVQIHR